MTDLFEGVAVNTDPQLPHSVEAERALLGSILIDPECMRSLSLESGDFYLLRHQTIFESMSRVGSREKSIDILTLIEDLNNVGQLEKIGGRGYLTDLVTSTPTSMHADSYAATIKDKARRRVVLSVARDITQAVFASGVDLESAVSTAVSSLVMSAGKNDGLKPYSEFVGSLLSQVSDAYAEPKQYYGIPTGFGAFDDITSGLQRKEVFMLSGEPGVGKSLLAMQLGVGMAKGANGVPGTPGAVFELEMSGIATVRRTMSNVSGVQARLLRSGHMTQEQYDAVLGAVAEMERLPIYMSDRTDWTTIAMRAELARLKDRGIGWVIIDYLGLLKDDQDKDEIERSAAISDRVHDIAKDLDLAIIAVHDMTKASVTGQVSGQAGLAGSRRVMYNADMTAFLRKGKGENELYLSWEKFREDSPKRRIKLEQRPGFPMFTESAVEGGILPTNRR